MEIVLPLLRHLFIRKSIVLEKQYVYSAIVRSIYDGDTIRVDIDLGFDMWIKNASLRLSGIDAPELRGEERPEGLKTRDWLREIIPPGTEVIIKTEKDSKEKFGRYLATIYFEGHNLNEQMVELGLAQVY
jgi:micrococcal nuclease